MEDLLAKGMAHAEKVKDINDLPFFSSFWIIFFHSLINFFNYRLFFLVVLLED